MIGIALVAAMGISGCGVTELNEEQNAQAAEYLAGIMLKHTKEYEKSLIYPEATEEPTVLPEETKEPSPTDKAEDDTNLSENGNMASANENETTLSDINDVMGIAQCKVTYKNMEECSSYQETKNASYGVFAERGKKLIAVKFKIKNTASENVEVNMYEKNVIYQLVLSDGKTITSQPTLLNNDMNYLSATIKKNKGIEGIVVFMANKGIDITGSKLKVIGKDKTAEINL